MPDAKFTCSFTGHRPSRFSFGYDEDDDRCIALKEVLRGEIEKLIKAGVVNFYTGMALGVDQWAALAVLDLKQTYPAIKLNAVLPCETQANKWSPEQRLRYYDTILSNADGEVLIQHRYTPDCMFKRNRWLVDHAEYVLAVYDGSVRGGTAYTVRYAKQCERKIITIHPDTLQVMYPDGIILPRGKPFRVVGKD